MYDAHTRLVLCVTIIVNDYDYYSNNSNKTRVNEDNMMRFILMFPRINIYILTYIHTVSLERTERQTLRSLHTSFASSTDIN